MIWIRSIDLSIFVSKIDSFFFFTFEIALKIFFFFHSAHVLNWLILRVGIIENW